MNSRSSDPMEPDDGTALSTVAWGLKHFAWVIVLGAVLGAVVVPWYQYQQPKQYDATALVVAADLRASITVLPRYSTSVFDNGVVAREVAGKFGAAGDPEDVVPKEVSMVAAQDSIVMEVIGHSENKEDAVKIADLAAVTFVEELNSPGAGVGVFEVQSQASAPVEATEAFRAAPYSVIVGTIGGSILGVGIVLLLIVLRRPVVAGSRRVVGLPVAGLVMLPRRRPRKSETSTRLEGSTTIARNVLGRAPDVVYVLGARGQSAATQMVTWSLRDALGRAPTKGALIRRVDGDAPLARPVIHIESPEDSRLLELPVSTLVLLVVQEGTSLSSLRRIADPFDPGQAAVVVVRRTFRNPSELSEETATPPPTSSTSTPAPKPSSPAAGLSRAKSVE
jgi:capsular polysaccharide biosynthesis protein